MDYRIDEHNPYGSFRPGQKEAITQILDRFDEGQKIVELNAPTASGKSLDLFVLGMCLSKDKGIDKVIYTTPLVALVDQLDKEPKFSAMPVLRGRRNYPCANNPEFTADECPFGAKKAAIAKCPFFKDCLYYIAASDWDRIPFGATTFAKYMSDPNVHMAAKVLLIDESASIEKVLLERSTLKLPEEVDLNDFRPTMTAYYEEVNGWVEDISKQVAEFVQDEDLKSAMVAKKEQRKYERISNKCAKILTHIDKKDPYIIDRERKFRLLDAGPAFKDIAENTKLIVLASGTPATDLLTKEFAKVKIDHPIPIDRRMVYYAPQGLMNYQERATTAPKMAEAIERLHAKHQKHTIVHCGAYNIARLIYDCLSDTKNVFLQDQKDREKARIDWMGAKDGIFLSVAFAEGLDLKGPEYPMNIIAKVPFENLSDGFIKYRNNHDNYLRYNTYAAVAVMQSAGRCTRSVDDFSETWILDTSWARFYSRCKSLFQPWFSAALKNGQVEDGQ